MDGVQQVLASSLKEGMTVKAEGGLPLRVMDMVERGDHVIIVGQLSDSTAMVAVLRLGAREKLPVEVCSCHGDGGCGGTSCCRASGERA